MMEQLTIKLSRNKLLERDFLKLS